MGGGGAGMQGSSLLNLASGRTFLIRNGGAEVAGLRAGDGIAAGDGDRGSFDPLHLGAAPTSGGRTQASPTPGSASGGRTTTGGRPPHASADGVCCLVQRGRGLGKWVVTGVQKDRHSGSLHPARDCLVISEKHLLHRRLLVDMLPVQATLVQPAQSVQVSQLAGALSGADPGSGRIVSPDQEPYMDAHVL